MAVRFCYHRNYLEMLCDYFGRSYPIWSIKNPWRHNLYSRRQYLHDFYVWAKWTISSRKWTNQTYKNSSLQHKWKATSLNLRSFRFFSNGWCVKIKNTLESRLASTSTTRYLLCLVLATWPFLLCAYVKALKDGDLQSKAMLLRKCIREVKILLHSKTQIYT